MKKQSASLHKIALAALFTVGNALIRYPWREGAERAVLYFLLSAVGALIPAFLLYPVLRRLWRTPLSRRRGLRLLMALLSVIAAAYAVYSAWRCCGDYVRFSAELVLPQGNRVAFTGLFLLCALWLSRLSDRGMASFALLGLAAALGCVLLLLCAGLPSFRWEYADMELIRMDWRDLKQIPSLWTETLLPLTVLALYFALVSPRGGIGSLAIGTGVGSAVLFVCVMQAILTFGASYAAELPYPYTASTRIPSVGQYFFRLEGFSYLLDYLSCLVRCAVSFAVVQRLYRRFDPMGGGWLGYGVGLGIFLFFAINQAFVA